MQQLAGPARPGDPNRVDLRFGTDAAGELYLLAKANGKIWKVTGTRTFAGWRRGRHPGGRRRRRATTGRRSPRRSGSSPATEAILDRARRRAARPAPAVRVRGADQGPGVRSVEINAQVRLDTPVTITNRDVIIVFGYRSDTRVLLRAPVDRQHDLPAQRHLPGQQRRPVADRPPVERLPRRATRPLWTRSGTASAWCTSPATGRDRRLRRRLEAPADDRHRTPRSAPAGSASARSTTSAGCAT